MSAMFAERPIEGEVNAGDTLAEQHPESEFVDALNTILNTKGCAAVRWTQYTPYFNDGDACVFRVNDPSVLPTGAGDSDDDDSWIDAWSLDDNSPLKTALKAFESVLDGGHHDVLLGKQFGDHAQVTATKEKFIVDFYDHD
jgi:hypothetical protein